MQAATGRRSRKATKPFPAEPGRWEAYVIAGGALQVEKQYDKAIDDFTNALRLAPASKQLAVKTLLQKCMKAQIALPGGAPPVQAGTPVETSPESTVTQAEVVLWKTI